MRVIKFEELKKIGNDIDKIFKEVTENDNLTLDELNKLSIENDKLNFSLTDYNTKLNYELYDLINKLKDKFIYYRLLLLLTMADIRYIYLWYVYSYSFCTNNSWLFNI